MVDASPRPLDSRVRPGIRCIGDWLGPTAGLDRCGKSRPHRDSFPGRSRTWRLTIQTALSRPTLLRSTTGNLYELPPSLWFKSESHLKLLHLWTGGHPALGNETRRFGNRDVPVLLGPVAENIPTNLVPRHPTTFGQTQIQFSKRLVPL